MKRLIFTLIVLALMATPVLGNASLGWWNEDDPSTTHQFWDFTPVPAEIVPTGATSWIILPDNTNNPSFAEGIVTAGGLLPGPDPFGLGYIDYFIGPEFIRVDLHIENYPNPSAYKEIWIDIEYTGTITNLGVLGLDENSQDGDAYAEVTLYSTGPRGLADFGFRIYPNPYEEKIWFEITGDPDGPGAARITSIHVDTICIPAPGAILLGSIGVGLVGWLRRRKSL